MQKETQILKKSMQVHLCCAIYLKYTLSAFRKWSLLYLKRTYLLSSSAQHCRWLKKSPVRFIQMVNLYKFVMKENVGWVKESDPDLVTYNKIGSESESGQNIRICNPYWTCFYFIFWNSVKNTNSDISLVFTPILR